MSERSQDSMASPLRDNIATFIGIDLAWQTDRKPTGAAVFRGDPCGAQVEVISTLGSIQEVLDFIQAHETEDTVLAIDAPLIITNQKGQRACETEVGKRYGSREASCHTSNLERFPEASTLKLTRSLLSKGYVHIAQEGEKDDRRGHILAEVYPHAAMVALFNLPKTLKYKKGRLTTKRSGLGELQNLLRTLSTYEPQLILTDALGDLLSKDLDLIAGRALKDYEDSLDALFCAYLAYYFWYWGWDRNELFGDLGSGYILNPTLRPQVPAATTLVPSSQSPL